MSVVQIIKNRDTRYVGESVKLAILIFIILMCRFPHYYMKNIMKKLCIWFFKFDHEGPLSLTIFMD